ncbi:hypothetical protein QFZ49_002653 [Streptomyces turgidiscabies]|uniref:Uncharacterized protein n=1 Tax=Streptomyces turgidiscabies TaxID=85558 RepID=A0ABU0RL55_9ACTN|nr:hypothetical protein [Streptomyces turgidiscabies]
MSAASGEPGDNPINLYKRTPRISLGEQAGTDRCQAGRAVHFGGLALDPVPATKLTSPREHCSWQHAGAASDLFNSPVRQS